MGPEKKHKDIAMNQGHGFSHSVARATLIAACVGCCVGVEMVLEAVNTSAPYLVFLPVVAGACALSGVGAAMWAILFSALSLWYFFLPPYGFSLPGYADLANLSVFVGVALFVCWVIDGLRRANDALTRDNVVLGCKISTLLTRARTQR